MNEEDEPKEKDEAPAPPPAPADEPAAASESAAMTPGDELAEILEAVEDTHKKEESVPPPVEPATGASSETSAEAAAAEQTGSYVYPDTGAASSQRLRLIPPDGKPSPWWVRHRETLTLAEMVLTGLFFLLTLYFLLMWIFSKPAMACAPDPSWKVAARPDRWTQIVVHHTATEAGTPASIDRNHREERKWENGLGYHFLIGNGKLDARGASMEDGEVHAGNRWTKQLDGAHIIMKGTRKGNSFSIGIALVGNMEKGPATPRQMASLRCLLRFLMEEYGIPRERIFGHGDISEKHTDCPGKYFPLKAIVNSL